MSFYDALQSQYDYVSGILSLLSTTNASTIDGTQIATTNSNLKNTITDLSNSIGLQNNVLTQQENVQRILDRESERLDYKQNSMDTVITGQKRLSELNRSYTEKYKAYNRILFYVFIFIILFIIILFLSYYIPEGITMILYIIIIVVFIIYLFWAYYDIWKRDPLNFDKLGSQSGLLLNKGQAASSSSRYDSIFNDLQTTVSLGNLGYCVGKDCCSTGTYFDVSSSTCLIGTDSSNEFSIGNSSISAFTTIEEAYTKKEISKNTTNINPIPNSNITKLEYAKI